VLSVNKIITMRKLNNTRFLLTKWKTQYEKNHSEAAKPRNIHYSEDKTIYKVVALTYP
jgi:hypothetical protein